VGEGDNVKRQQQFYTSMHQGGMLLICW